MVNEESQLNLNKNDLDLKLLYTLLAPNGHFTLLKVESTEDEVIHIHYNMFIIFYYDQSVLQCPDGQSTRGTAAIIEHLMHHFNYSDSQSSPKNMFGASELDYADVCVHLSHILS